MLVVYSPFVYFDIPLFEAEMFRLSVKAGFICAFILYLCFCVSECE